MHHGDETQNDEEFTAALVTTIIATLGQRPHPWFSGNSSTHDTQGLAHWTLKTIEPFNHRSMLGLNPDSIKSPSASDEHHPLAGPKPYDARECHNGEAFLLTRGINSQPTCRPAIGYAAFSGRCVPDVSV